ncbi:hypothetical protein SISNIDRAFT_35447 [Sistotremastrum niveocremeum HHB9708]|uniref:Uncharacterized protein n=1 Tax=Sistotremastrum niveocremeum HHB9708 TaxID=1314777 RepID=A0A164WCG2_9AGAM|nr:hypothetical protein SISNIDRAFT_35447 [Sistotremastrum niveocremeum HHB9708]
MSTQPPSSFSTLFSSTSVPSSAVKRLRSSLSLIILWCLIRILGPYPVLRALVARFIDLIGLSGPQIVSWLEYGGAALLILDSGYSWWRLASLTSNVKSGSEKASPRSPMPHEGLKGLTTPAQRRLQGILPKVRS